MCEWFKNAGLGMFVHWGVYSILGRGEWVMQQEDIALDDYDKLIDQFQPDNFNADEWCQLACEAGAEYVILTTRHHDGVCLFDTKTTDRNTVARGAHRDFIREYADACRRHGLKVGFYYSLPDWSDPGFNGGLAGKDTPEYAHFIDNIYTQIRELLTNYGKVDVLWYDGAPNLNGKSGYDAETLRTEELAAMVRSLQPGIIFNNRSCQPGDFHTAEQVLTPPEDPNRLWEGCITFGNHWAWCPHDDHLSRKTVFRVLLSMTGVAFNGGHLLLNVGPDPSGRIPYEDQRAFREIGAWVKKNRESIKGMKNARISGATWGCAARKGDFVYLYVHWRHESGEIVIPHCTEKFYRGEILEDGKPVTLTYDNRNRLIVSGSPAGYLLPVIKLYTKDE